METMRFAIANVNAIVLILDKSRVNTKVLIFAMLMLIVGYLHYN